MLGRPTLRRGAVVFVLTWLIHNADHARRGLDGLSDGVTWAGTLAAVLAAAAVTLILTEHPVAPIASVIVFASIAVGVSATHLLPDWGYFSDPLLVDSATDNWSIAAVVPEIAAAGALAVIGLEIVRRNGYALHIAADRWAASEPAPLTEAGERR